MATHATLSYFTGMAYKVVLPASGELFQRIFEEEPYGISAVQQEEEGMLYAESPEQLIELLDDSSAHFIIEHVKEEDWRDSWQNDLAPLSFKDGLIKISPQSLSSLSSDLILSPGRSFGIGHHPTTAMVIELLCENREKLLGKSILDFGCGSGVLSFVASKLGAGSVIGCDDDPDAISISRKNAEANNINNIEFFPGSNVSGSFDVLLLNVLHVVGIEYISELKNSLADNALIISSGFLSDEVETVALEYGVRLLASKQSDEWGALFGVISSDV